MLNRPAASAAPVPPAQTSACARPSATARAACTIEASGLARTALAGSALLAIETGASTISTPGGGLAQLGGRAEQDHARAPRGGERGAGGDLGRTEVGAVAVDRDDRAVGRSRRSASARRRTAARAPPRRYSSWSCSWSCSCAPARRPRGRRRCRTPGTPGAAAAGCGTAGTRSPRACRSCAAHGASRCGCATAFSWGPPSDARRLPARGRAYSSLSSRSFAQRGSGALSWRCSGPASLRSAAQIGHSPAQSSRQSTLLGTASANASRAQAARSSVSSLDVGAFELLASARPVDLARVDLDARLAPAFRQRMHGPGQRRREAQPQRVAAAHHARDVEHDRDADALRSAAPRA